MENEMNNKITYHQEGDYLIPDIKLPEENPKYKNKTIGKYGRVRLNYLKENKKGLYQQLLTENKLFEHLVDINEEAKTRIKLITNQIAEQEHINEYQKGKDALDWVCAMNNAQARAEEIVFKELIYVQKEGKKMEETRLYGMYD